MGSSTKSSLTEIGGDTARQQRSLATVIKTEGVGLHLGQQTTVRLMPASPDAGRYFVRTDLPDAPPIQAHVSSVVKTQLSTELGTTQAADAVTVRTVEHLLSALTALAIDNVRIEIDGPELPLLDGSAQSWVEAITTAGSTSQPATQRRRPPVTQPVWVRADQSFVAALPSSELRFSYGIDFDLPAIGNQWHSWSPAHSSFATDIAPARTFGLAHQIEYLRSQGLIKGGSLENALVCGEQGWLNPPLRFDNEPARHKLLDLIGDLSLLGDIPVAHYVAYAASHTLHIELATQLAQHCPFSEPLSETVAASA